MRIAIASGKGGTGKTTIAVNLASVLTLKGIDATYVDCDVEEPNGHIFLNPEIERTEKVGIPVPEVDSELCTLCGECAAICQFNAIITTAKKVMVFEDLCHGCGGCMHVCPTDAITEKDNYIGIIETGTSGNTGFMHGKLDVGRAFSPPIIKELKRNIPANPEVVVDCPPGTSCPVIHSISDADYVVLVTEPTPFGVNDLKLAVGVMRKLEIPFGVIVNRSDVGDDEVRHYCNDEGIEIILEIPDDIRIARSYSRGKMLIEEIPEYVDIFFELFTKIKSQVKK